MRADFEPKLCVLPERQRLFWPELAEVSDSFVLCGGTAIALQLGHRSSLDFDFITREAFDPDALYQKTRFLRESRVVQKSVNTLTCVVDRKGPVHISFFATPTLQLIETPLKTSDNGVQVASLVDLSAMKAAVRLRRLLFKSVPKRRTTLIWTP
jgi:hypothetical protein